MTRTFPSGKNAHPRIPDFTDRESELVVALERVVGSLESKGAWKVANALSIARAALIKARGEA